MLIKYRYRTNSYAGEYRYRTNYNVDSGWHQCDLEDFKKLWNRLHRSIVSCSLQLQSGELFEYKKYRKHKWQKC